MAHDICGECGRPHESSGDLPILDIDGRRLTGEGGREPAARHRSGLVGAATAVVALIFGIWVIGSYGGSRESAPSGGAGSDLAAVTTDPSEESAVDETALEGGSEVRSPDDTVGGIRTGDPDDLVIGSGMIASSLLTSLHSDARISFLSGRSVTTVDLGSGEVTTAAVGTEQILDLTGYVLLHDGTTSVAISRDDPTDVMFLGSTGEVVTQGDKDYTIISPPGEAGRDLFVGGTLEGVTRVLTSPAGSGLLSVPGLGVLVTPPTGGTYLTTVRGFELWSSGRVLTSTESAHLELRCDATLECAAVIVDHATGDEKPVEFGLVDGVETTLLSPDSRWLLTDGAGGTLLHDTATGVADPLSVASPGAPRWAPDSSFLAWLDTSGEVPAFEFAVVDSESRGTFRVGLSSLSDDLLPDEAFVLYD